MKFKLLLPLPFLLVFPLSLKAQVCALNLASGSATLANTGVTYCSVSLSAGATLFIGGSVTMTVTGNVDIEGTVEGVALGYGSTYTLNLGPGAGGNRGIYNGGGGGGHGGAGGNAGTVTGTGIGGPANDSPANPILMGSAGGGTTPGGGFIPPSGTSGAGGAAFFLNAPSGTVTLNGLIDVSGQYSHSGFGTGAGGGGGAGGTLSITAQTILFNGTLKAVGGNGGDGWGAGGGGGGGLILLCPSLAPLSGPGTASVAGGAGGSFTGHPIPAGANGTAGATGIYTVCSPPTPTPTPVLQASIDIFRVSLNLFTPSQGPVSLYVATNQGPGAYSLEVFNSAGEFIKTLDQRRIGASFHQSYLWDGTNKNGDACASGLYFFELTEPLNRERARILLVR